MKDFELRRPAEDYAVHIRVERDGPRGLSLLFRAGNVVTLVPLDAPIGDGSKCPNGAPRTLRSALLEHLLVGATIEAPAQAPATRAAVPGEARELLFEHDADGNIVRAIDQRAR
jgi:hypothetical protein